MALYLDGAGVRRAGRGDGHPQGPGPLLRGRQRPASLLQGDQRLHLRHGKPKIAKKNGNLM